MGIEPTSGTSGTFFGVLKSLSSASGFQLSFYPLKPNPPAVLVGECTSVFWGLLTVDDCNFFVVPNAQPFGDRWVVRDVVLVPARNWASREGAPWRLGQDQAGCAAHKFHALRFLKLGSALQRRNGLIY